MTDFNIQPTEKPDIFLVREKRILESAEDFSSTEVWLAPRAISLRGLRANAQKVAADLEKKQKLIAAIEGLR